MKLDIIIYERSSDFFELKLFIPKATYMYLKYNICLCDDNDRKILTKSQRTRKNE